MKIFKTPKYKSETVLRYIQINNLKFIGRTLDGENTSNAKRWIDVYVGKECQYGTPTAHYIYKESDHYEMWERKSLMLLMSCPLVGRLLLVSKVLLSTITMQIKVTKKNDSGGNVVLIDQVLPP